MPRVKGQPRTEEQLQKDAERMQKLREVKQQKKAERLAQGLVPEKKVYKKKSEKQQEQSVPVTIQLSKDVVKQLAEQVKTRKPRKQKSQDAEIQTDEPKSE